MSDSSTEDRDAGPTAEQVPYKEAAGSSRLDRLVWSSRSGGRRRSHRGLGILVPADAGCNPRRGAHTREGHGDPESARGAARCTSDEPGARLDGAGPNCRQRISLRTPLLRADGACAARPKSAARDSPVAQERAANEDERQDVQAARLEASSRELTAEFPELVSLAREFFAARLNEEACAAFRQTWNRVPEGYDIDYGLIKTAQASCGSSPSNAGEGAETFQVAFQSIQTH